MTKLDLLSQIENVKNNYILGLSAISILSEHFAVEHLSKSRCSFGDYIVDFQGVAALLGQDCDRKIALKEFTTMLVRTLLKESFEVVKAYTKLSGQYTKFKAQPWFHFFRLVRNCVSHNFHFDFRDCDRKILPVSWKGRTIDKGLDGKPMEIAFLGYDGVWRLFSEIEKFSTDQLK